MRPVFAIISLIFNEKPGIAQPTGLTTKPDSTKNYSSINLYRDPMFNHLSAFLAPKLWYAFSMQIRWYCLLRFPRKLIISMLPSQALRVCALQLPFIIHGPRLTQSSSVCLYAFVCCMLWLVGDIVSARVTQSATAIFRLEIYCNRDITRIFRRLHSAPPLAANTHYRMSWKTASWRCENSKHFIDQTMIHKTTWLLIFVFCGNQKTLGIFLILSAVLEVITF